MVFINATESIGIIIGTATTTTTGSIFITLLMVLILLMALAILFNIPLEYTAIILFPLLLGYAAYYSEFIGILAVIIIYFAIILTKNFLFR